VEEHVARFVERCDLAASLGLVAPVHVAEATWARNRADTSSDEQSVVADRRRCLLSDSVLISRSPRRSTTHMKNTAWYFL
jgi:hypothetical protein